jgi:hypothetical protein
MTMLKERSAADLAAALDAMQHHRHNTGGLSMLDEATLEFGWRYDTVGPAQQAFANARQRHMRSYTTERGNYSDEAWDAAIEAAQRLAAVLRPLGDTRIPRCHEQSRWGTCGIGLNDDGTCKAARDHATA